MGMTEMLEAKSVFEPKSEAIQPYSELIERMLNGIESELTRIGKSGTEAQYEELLKLIKSEFVGICKDIIPERDTSLWNQMMAECCLTNLWSLLTSDLNPAESPSGYEVSHLTYLMCKVIDIKNFLGFWKQQLGYYGVGLAMVQSHREGNE